MHRWKVWHLRTPKHISWPSKKLVIKFLKAHGKYLFSMNILTKSPIKKTTIKKPTPDLEFIIYRILGVF